MKKITTTGSGFQLTFHNGWTVSVQSSPHHYCTEGLTAEVWAWKDDKDYPANGPAGWRTPDEVAIFIEKVRKF